MGASVWIKSSKGPAFMSLAFADTIPKVTVVANPNGLPIAKAQLPTLALSELPQFTGVNSKSVSTFKIAKSVFLSEPINLACRDVPSCNTTVIEVELATTWLFVTIYPALSIINPEPAAVSFLLCLGVDWHLFFQKNL